MSGLRRMRQKNGVGTEGSRYRQENEVRDARLRLQSKDGVKDKAKERAEGMRAHEMRAHEMRAHEMRAHAMRAHAMRAEEDESRRRREQEEEDELIFRDVKERRKQISVQEKKAAS